MFEISKQDLQKDVCLAMSNQTIQTSDIQAKAQKLLSALKTDFSNGLNGVDLKERQIYFGENTKNVPYPSCRNALSQNFSKNITIQLQIVLSLFSLIAYLIDSDWTYWIESIVILTLLVADLLLKIKEIKRENEINSELMKEQHESLAIVIRNGQQIEIPVKEICVGDILLIRMGDIISADGFIIQSDDFSIDEFAITGQAQASHKVSSLENLKDQQINLNILYVFKGTRVVNGRGKILVLAVGQHTFQAEVLEKKGKAGLEQALVNIRKKSNVIQLIFTFIIILILLIKILTNAQKSNFLYLQFAAKIVNLIIVLGGCAVSKSIFLHMAITQSQSVKKLLLAQNLVRKVESIEKLAYMDQILLDQSTLIKNELTVVGFWNDKYNPIEKYSKLNFLQNLSPQLQESLEQAMFLNNTIRNESDSGNAADMALFKFSEKWNYNFKEIEDQKDFTIIRIPFDSTRKRNTSVINNKRVVVRGALELILSFSTRYQSLSNGLCDLTEDLKEQISQQYNSAHRTQALAYRDLIGDINCQQLINNASFDLDKKELIFIGFLSLTYPVKNGAQSVINQIKQAGIGVKLITGNQIAFAQEVAKECGIFTEGAICKNGCDFVQDFHNKNYDIEDLTVLARSRPEDNLALLTELQKIGHVVGVYGDGTNDAPALMKADVGFCGGMNSTEIARECSGIILLDDNIRSILSGIMFGRNLVESLKKFLQYSIITINSLLIIQIVYSITNSEVFSIFQLLWISLIIEILASIVIVQSFDLQQRLIQKPNMKGELKINKFMIGNIIILIIYTILTTLLISNSIIHGFNIFIFITIFNIISSSKLHFEINVFKGLSWIAGSILLGIFGLQIIIIELGDTVMKTSGGLTIIEWVTSFIVGLGSIIVRGLMIIVIRFLLSSFKINEESYD